MDHAYNKARNVAAKGSREKAGADLVRVGTAIAYASLLALIYRELVGIDSIVDLGVYNLSTTEPVIALLLWGVLLAIMRGRFRLTLLMGASLLLFMAWVISITRGIEVDTFKSLFSARPVIAIPLFCIFGVLTVGLNPLYRKAASAVKWTGVALALLVFSRFTTGFPYSGALAMDTRPLFNYGALFTGVAGLLLLSDGVRQSRALWQLVLATFVLLSCILSGQGTAIIATLVALPLVLVGERGRYHDMRRVAGGLIIVTALAAYLLAPVVFETLASNAALDTYIGQRTQTNMTRQTVWVSFVDGYSKRSAADQLFGLPLGQTEDIIIDLWNGTKWNRSLHSMYFQTMSDIGYFGLGAYVLVLLAVALNLLFAKRSGAQSAEPMAISPITALAITLAIAIYGYSYDFRGEAAFLLMIVINAAANARKNSLRRPAPPSAPAPIMPHNRAVSAAR